VCAKELDTLLRALSWHFKALKWFNLCGNVFKNSKTYSILMEKFKKSKENLREKIKLF
jgi:hypothetical protein